MSNQAHQTSNQERQTSSQEHQASNQQHQTSSQEHQTSNQEHQANSQQQFARAFLWTSHLKPYQTVDFAYFGCPAYAAPDRRPRITFCFEGGAD